MAFTVTFPKPPALNHLYGNNRFGGKFLKKEGKAWQKSAFAVLQEQEGSKERWGVPAYLEIELRTCRQQDNDSILKLLMDTLEEWGVVANDYWFFRVVVVKNRVKKVEEAVVVSCGVIETKIEG